MIRTSAILIAMAMLFIAGGSATAATYGTVTAKVLQAGYGLNMASMLGPYDTSWWSGYTGQYILQYSNMQPALPLTTIAYCIEVETISWGGVYPYTVVSAYDTPVKSGPADQNGGPMGPDKAQYLSELWGRFAGQVNSNVSGAAFALATYEIVFEDLSAGWDLDSGLVKARRDSGDPTLAINLAESWLAQINGLGPMAQIVGLTNSGRQDFIVGELPEPMSVVLAVMGSFTLVGLRRLRRI